MAQLPYRPCDFLQGGAGAFGFTGVDASLFRAGIPAGREGAVRRFEGRCHRAHDHGRTGRGGPTGRPSPRRRRTRRRRASAPPSRRSVVSLESADDGGFSRRYALRLTDPPRAGSPTRPTPGLTFVTPGVLSTARLARHGRPVADCRGCSVECRCCAPPAGRTGSESHSTRRPICRKAALGRTYGNLSGSAARWFSQAPGGFLPPASRSQGLQLPIREIRMDISVSETATRPTAWVGGGWNRARQVPERFERQDY